ncbi:uncharacterized protein LOC108095781 [Drosophila ficusphila]|uniref:uncharacterized protein LOC108095781 n=1 Tax=Drosophila ficusphila TaxID=30025 RepID=UPI0007E7898B|nr:uncharacterized protein LOC108095781 [Drosophila ficusphila]
MCRRAVREWLVLLTMEKYIGRFLERGYDSIANCKLIVASDLVMLGVDDATHRKLLLDGVQFLINAPEKFICAEPCELHHYLEKESDPEIECLKSSIFQTKIDREHVEDSSPPKIARRTYCHEFNKVNHKETNPIFTNDVQQEKGYLNEDVCDDEDEPVDIEK